MRPSYDAPIDDLHTMDQIESKYLAGFSAFCDRVCDQPGVFFTFCSTGLLHVQAANLRTLPRDFPVACVFSELAPEELAWVERNLSVPWFNIPLRVDDKTIWEFLFRTCRHPFGWLDADCFLLDLVVVRELTYDEGCVLSGPMIRRPLPLIRTPLVYCRPELIERVQVDGAPVSPATYAPVPTRLGRHAPHAWSRMLDAAHVSHLTRRFDVDEWGVPRNGQRGIYDCYAGGAILHTDETRAPHAFQPEPAVHPLFDTLVLFQLSALAHGLPLGVTRTYPSNKTISPELAHFGRVGRLVDDTGTALSAAAHSGSGAREAFSFFAATLDWFCGTGEVPAAYRLLLESVEKELHRLGGSLERNRLEFLSRLAAHGALRYASRTGHGPWSFLRQWLASFE